MPETEIPIAAGKAAALQSYLAQGRELVTKNGKRRYTSGPMKGKTLEEASADFERRWETVDPSVQDKYARRASADGALAPSEKAAMGVTFNPSVPKPAAPAAPAPAPATTAQAKPPTPPAQPVERAAPLAPSPAQRTPSDTDYATIADQRQATGYPEATRATPFTGGDVRKANDSGFGPNATPTGRPIGVQPRINRLTGLPFGYQPGDNVAPGQQMTALASVKRQQDATAAAPAIPRAIPVIQPGNASAAPAPSFEQGVKQTFQRQADILKNGVNNDDLRAAARGRGIPLSVGQGLNSKGGQLTKADLADDATFRPNGSGDYKLPGVKPLRKPQFARR